MSYFQNLDEYPEQHLIDELNRRKELRHKGLCDYCEREPTTRPCRFEERHKFDTGFLDGIMNK